MRRYKAPRKKRNNRKCSARVIPYFIDDNNEIVFVMVKIRQYQDWTAMGGHCESITVDCSNEQNASKIENCVLRELEEETRHIINGSDVDITRLRSFNYVDRFGVTNNFRFAEIVGNLRNNLIIDPDYISSVFNDIKLINSLKNMPKNSIYFESDDIMCIKLRPTFLTYAENVNNTFAPANQKIDRSVLMGLKEIFDTIDLSEAELVSEIETFIITGNYLGPN